MKLLKVPDICLKVHLIRKDNACFFLHASDEAFLLLAE